MLKYVEVIFVMRLWINDQLHEFPPKIAKMLILFGQNAPNTPQFRPVIADDLRFLENTEGAWTRT
jgi:hypothetical protein